MSTQPIISGAQMVAALKRVGYEVVRQKGSHVRLRCASDPRRKPTTVLLHKTLKPGTLRAILADAGLSVAALQALLK